MTKNPKCIKARGMVIILPKLKMKRRPRFFGNASYVLATRATCQSGNPCPNSSARVPANRYTVLIAFFFAAKVDSCVQKTKSLISCTTRQLVPLLRGFCVRFSQGQNELTCTQTGVRTVGNYFQMGFVQM